MTDSEPAALARLDRRMDALAEDMAALKASHAAATPGALERFRAHAGVVALVISLATGGFTLYDRIVLEPARESAAQAAAVRADLDALSAISLAIQQAFLKDEETGLTTRSALAPRRVALIKRAEKAYERRPQEFLFNDLLMMSDESLQFNQIAAAKRFGEAALGLAEGSVERLSAHMMLAHAYAAYGPDRDAAGARDHLQMAYDGMRADPDAPPLGVLDVLTERLSFELAEHECDLAQAAVDATRAFMDATHAPTDVRARIFHTYTDLSMTQRPPMTCALDLAGL
jgi:hypothetical protein